jgi:hypothetical protein
LPVARYPLPASLSLDPRSPKLMAARPAHSLRHEYGLYVEREIENYKESVPRSVLLSIGDEAVSSLAKLPQLALTELLLCEEVDRLIVRRLRLPTYTTWRKRRAKFEAEQRRPERWGLTADDGVVRAVERTGERGSAQALVADPTDEAHTLYLAANGCDVTALSVEEDAVDRVLEAAREAGFGERVRSHVGSLGSWLPHGPLTAVIVSPAALAGLSDEERARVIAALQSATVDGGVHLVRTISGGVEASIRGLDLAQLAATYRGWDVTMEPTAAGPSAFVARKGVA